jgi:hypothetical protein
MRRTQICRISVSGRRSFQGARATPATAPGPEAQPRLERILSEMRTQARLDALT